MRTPIKELIDSVGNMAQGLDADELYDYFMEKATQMLEKERKVIEDAYHNGQARGLDSGGGFLGEFYYDEVFTDEGKCYGLVLDETFNTEEK